MSDYPNYCDACGEDCTEDFELCDCGLVFCPECYEGHIIECDEAPKVRRRPRYEDAP